MSMFDQKEKQMRGVVQAVEGGGTIYNGWLSSASPHAAEAMATVGFESLTLDLQHGAIGYEGAVGMLQALTGTGVIPLARVPWNDPGTVMKLLDAGCMGIICPMVNSRADCEKFVGACKYPAVGYRSFGPVRAKYITSADYAAEANSSIAAIAMIETVEALENLDAILSVEGLDGVFVGPADLGISMGFAPKLDWRDGPVYEALLDVRRRAVEAGKFAGVYTASAEYAREMSDAGFRFISVQSDIDFMTQRGREVVSKLQ